MFFENCNWGCTSTLVSKQSKQKKEKENNKTNVFQCFVHEKTTTARYSSTISSWRRVVCCVLGWLFFFDSIMYGRQWCCFFFFYEKGMAVAWRGMFWGFACCAFGKLGGDVYPSTIPISPCFVSKGKILLWAYYYCITPTYILRSIHFVYCVLVQHLLTAHLTAVR